MHPAVIKRLKISAAILAAAFLAAFTYSFTTDFWSLLDEPKDYLAGTADLPKEVELPKLDIPAANNLVPAPAAVSAAPSQSWWLEAPVTPRYDHLLNRQNGVGAGVATSVPDLNGVLERRDIPPAPGLPQAAVSPPVTFKPLFGTSAGGLTSGDSLPGAVTGVTNAVQNATSPLKR